MNTWNPGKKYEDRNKYRFIDQNTVEVRLTKGKTTFIDKVDLPILNNICWHMATGNRVQATLTESRENVKMARYIMGRMLSEKGNAPLKSEEHVSHLNGNSLDNRRGNLEIGTIASISRATRISKTGNNSLDGIRKSKKCNAYMVSCRTNDGRKNKQFNIDKYGIQEALRMAIEWRDTHKSW